MKFIAPSLSNHRGPRACADATAAGIKCVRDRGLDHAVARDKNLRPLLDLKNLIKSEPSKSLPISIINQRKEPLRIPFRPIEFVRHYPSIFQEFLPGGIGVHPHIKLTPEVLDLDADEQLVYQSDSYKQDLADRLLKLLMISRINKIPLNILDALKWDLGLPKDYVESVVPEFPDYFRLLDRRGSGDDGELELVCWSDELAVSVLEKKTRLSGQARCSKGMPIVFPMKFSKGFEVDKKVKKWMEGWQKLPYISPYDNASHLVASGDESDRWAAAVLHELLNLFVSKKAERDHILYFGEFLGLRSRFKRVLLHHPGVFYVSGKIRTFTVVLRDAYKRGMLIESSPLLGIRNRYIKLMNKDKEEERAVSSRGESKQEGKGKSKGEVCDGGGKDEVDDSSVSEVEDEHEEEEEEDGDGDDGFEGVKQRQKGVGRGIAAVGGSGRGSRRKNSDVKEGRRRNSQYQGEKGRRNLKGSEERLSLRHNKVKLLTEKRSRI